MNTEREKILSSEINSAGIGPENKYPAPINEASPSEGFSKSENELQENIDINLSDTKNPADTSKFKVLSLRVILLASAVLLGCFVAFVSFLDSPLLTSLQVQLAINKSRLPGLDKNAAWRELLKLSEDSWALAQKERGKRIEQFYNRLHQQHTAVATSSLLSSPEYNDAHVISLLARAHAFSTAALNEAKRLGDEELVSQTYSFLGCSVKRSSPISLEAYNEAERCLQKSLDIELKKHGERHLHVMKVYESLGEIYEGRERYRTNDPIAVDNQISLSETRSEVFFQKALYSAETANGPNSKAAHLILAFHPFHFTDIRSHSGNPFFYDWNNFYCWYIDRAVFYEDKSKPVADRYYRAAIEEMKDFCGEFHPYTAIALNAFACFLRGEHLDEEASDYEHQADIIWDRERKHPTKFHRIILPTEQGIGPKKYLFLGDISKARKEWQKSYTAGPALADALLGYSRYLKQQNKLSQSLQLEKEASKILTEYKLMSTLLSRERIMRKQDWI